jgi:hypothetical protein
MNSSNAGNPTEPQGINRRSIRNFLLQPLLQVQLGLYSILLAFAFSGVIAWLFYIHLNSFATIVIQLTDTEDEVLKMLYRSLDDMRFSVIGTIFCFLIANMVVSVLFTHKMVGPTIAFRRLIRGLSEGKYGDQIKLRDGDAFTEVADELNHLSSVLSEKYGGKS